MKDAMRIERLLNKKFKATLGQAQGIGKSKTEAIKACEAMIVDMLTNGQTPRMEVRDGYLLISQVEGSEHGWYTIKKISDLQNGFFHPLCMMNASGLKTAIDSHLAQYKES